MLRETLSTICKFTKVVLLTWVLCPLVLSALAVFSTQAQAVSLKQNTTLSSDTIILSDVFDDLPRNGDKVLGIAPKPGQEMVLNSRTLLRIALAMDLPWRPASVADQIVLKRAASIVTEDKVESAVKQALADKGIDSKYHIKFPTEKTEIILPENIEPSVEVSALKISDDKTRFDVTLSSPSVKNPLQVTKLTGLLQQMVDVPVLKDTMGMGSIIGAGDIEYKPVEAASVGRDVILQAQNLVGMAPRKLITAGSTIESHDVESPRMVNRGDVVTMVFKEGSLLLTAQGKALQNGTKGDQIRVTNTNSNKTIDAIVSNDREVTIQSF